MRDLASATSASKSRSSSTGAGTGISAPRPLGDVEGVHEVVERVVRADAVVDADQHEALLARLLIDADVEHVDPRLELRERVADLEGEVAERRVGDRREHRLVYAAPEARVHRPLATRRAEDDPDRLLDVLLPTRVLEAAVGADAEEKRPADAEMVGMAARPELPGHAHTTTACATAKAEKPRRLIPVSTNWCLPGACTARYVPSTETDTVIDAALHVPSGLPPAGTTTT